ncbi:MAG: hypothetical protein P9L99_16590 [Candidatus Lernaella stagnicola]|nr:hypothetical protein [Candidatus Lernaella stagnicola]
MSNTIGFKTTATEPWIRPFLVGSNVVTDAVVLWRAVSAALAQPEEVYLIVTTTADIVVIDLSKLQRTGYATKADGFLAVAALPNGDIFAVADADNKVYRLQMDDVDGDSTAKLEEYLSTSVGPGSVRLATNTAKDIKAERVSSDAGGSLNMLYVLIDEILNIINVTDETKAVCEFGGDTIADGGYGENTLAWSSGRFLHSLLEVSTYTVRGREAYPVFPSFSFGGVADDFNDNTNDTTLWYDIVNSKVTGTIVEQNQRREFSVYANEALTEREGVLSVVKGSLAGPVTVETSWTVTNWPTLQTDEGADVRFLGSSSTLYAQYHVYRERVFDGANNVDSLVAAVGIWNAAPTEETSNSITSTADTGEFRVSKDENVDEVNTSGVDHYTDSGWESEAPKYRVRMQYKDGGDWVTLFTHYTDDESALCCVIGAVTTGQSAGGSLQAYFDDFGVTDDSPLVYRDLIAPGSLQGAGVGTMRGQYANALLFEDHVRMLRHSTGVTDSVYALGSPVIDLPLAAESADPEDFPQAHCVLPPANVTNIAFADDLSRIFVGTEQGIAELSYPNYDLQNNFHVSPAPSQPLVDENITFLAEAQGWVFYGTQNGAGLLSPDCVATGVPQNATMLKNELDQLWDADWEDPTDSDFYATNIGRLSKTMAYDDVLVEWLLSDGTWLREDPWSEDFSDENLDTDRWDTLGTVEIDNSELLLVAENSGTTAYSECCGKTELDGDFDAVVGLAAGSWQCASSGDLVEAGLVLGDVDADAILVQREREHDGASVKDRLRFTVYVSGSIEQNTAVEVDSGVTDLWLRLYRRGSRVAGFCRVGERWILLDQYADFTNTSLLPAMYLRNADVGTVPDSTAVVARFDDLQVDGRPDYDFLTGQAIGDLTGGYWYYVRSVDDAGNWSGLTGIEEIVVPDFVDDANPWVDSFIIADTLVDPNIGVVQRPPESGRHLGKPTPHEANRSQTTLLALDGALEDDDFQVRIRAISNSPGQYVLQPKEGILAEIQGESSSGQDDPGGWMARGAAVGWSDPRIIDVGAETHPLRHISGIEDENGDLFVVYENGAQIMAVSFDHTTGEAGNPDILLPTAKLPAVALHRESGHKVMVVASIDRKVVTCWKDRGFGWERIGIVIRKSEDTIQSIRLVSLKSFGSEKLVLAMGSTEEGAEVEIWGSYDAGQTWLRWAKSADLFDEDRLDDMEIHPNTITLTAGPSGSGEVAVLAVRISEDPYPDIYDTCHTVVSGDGSNWYWIGPYWGSDSSGDNSYQRYKLTFAALPARIANSSVEEGLSHSSVSNWLAMSTGIDDSGERFLELTHFHSGPHHWPDIWLPDEDETIADRPQRGDSPEKFQFAFGGVTRTRVPLPSDRPAKNMAFAIWRGRPVFFIVCRPDENRRLIVMECMRWQRPADRTVPARIYMPNIPNEDVWSASTGGGYTAVQVLREDNGMTLATDVGEYYRESLDDADFDWSDGVKIRFVVQCGHVSDLSGHGLHLRLRTDSGGISQAVEVKVRFDASTIKSRGDTVHLYDVNASATPAATFEFDEYPGEIEGILAIGPETDDLGVENRAAQLWLRQAGGQRQTAYFTMAGFVRLKTDCVSGDSFFHFGVVDDSPTAPGATRWRSVQVGQAADNMHCRTDNYSEMDRALAAGGQLDPMVGGIYVGDTAQVIPFGRKPVAGDEWLLSAASDFPIEQAIAPDFETWRSATDDTGIEIVFDSDPRANGRGFIPGGLGFFGANFPRVIAQFNNENSWDDPEVEIEADGWRSRGSFGQERGNGLQVLGFTRRWRPGTGKTTQDEQWQSALQDHELGGLYLKVYSGDATGRVYLLEDNVGGTLHFAGANPVDNSAQNGDQFYIFGHNLVALPMQLDSNSANYRYLRLLIPAGRTYEGYFQLGAIAVGPLHQVATDASCRTWSDLSNTLQFPVRHDRFASGLLNPVREGHDYREITLKWNGLSPSQAIGLEAFFRRLGGAETPVVYLPIERRNDVDSVRGCYEAVLGRIVTERSVLQPITAAEVWENATVTLEEIPMRPPQRKT